MSDRLTNVELLIMLSQDVKAQGDDLSREMTERGASHARRVIELLGMLENAKAMLESERQRFSMYLPRTREEMPRVVRQGPAEAKS